MRNLLFACNLACLLSACGGGGGNLANLDRDFENDGQSNEVIKQFHDGSALVVTKGNLKSLVTIEEPSYFFSITANPTELVDTFNGALNLEVVSRDDFGGTDYYETVYTGRNASGKQLDARTLGYFLDGSGNQVSVTLAAIGEDAVLFNSGTLVNGMPSGRHTYSRGDAIIGYKDDVEVSYNSMTVVVDFDEMTGSVVAETDNLFFSANDFVINAANGTFNGDDATIGRIGGEDIHDADINGAFAGVAAAGIHGMVSSKVENYAADDADGGVGIFYAIRD